MSSRPTDSRLTRVIDFYEQLRPQDLPRLGELYADDARFRDPFNDVQGLAAIERIFRHMFEQQPQARFVVTGHCVDGPAAVLRWDFMIRLRGRPHRIHGASWLRFGPDGRIEDHRDFWDPAEELYAHLPLLGGLMRWLQRQLRA